MGNSHSAKRKKLFPFLPSSASSYKHLSDDDSALLNQPLLPPEENLYMGIENEVQANWEKSSTLEKEIRELKSNFSRLEIKVQNSILKAQAEGKAAEGEKQKAISNIKEKNINVEKDIAELKSRVNVIMSSTRQTSEGEKQKAAISSIEEKNFMVEKDIAELKNRVNEIMSSTMAKLAPVDAELKNQQKLDMSIITDYSMITNLGEIQDWFFIIIIFLVCVIIGLIL